MAVRPTGPLAEVPQPLSRKEERQETRAIGPPESLDPSVIYNLYRGATGEIASQKHRVWVEFPALQLCWTRYDTPAGVQDRVSLLDVSRCHCQRVSSPDVGELYRVDIFTRAGDAASVQPRGPAAQEQVVGVLGPKTALHDFGLALQQLFENRDNEGRSGLDFIQKRLFQYLWKHQGNLRSEAALYEAQAVLTFNLEPKEGVAYLKSKLGKRTDSEVGEWLAQMSTQKGGLDPTMLGSYFSRRDTLDVFRAFVRCLDFTGSDIVAALRRLFDTFKPGGEGQVITRILELFAEAYFLQWQRQEAVDPKVPRAAFKEADSVLKVAVSLIMLNTGLHVAPKKLKNAASAQMTVEEYIHNTRLVVDAGEVPEESLRNWYDAVKEAEISLQPLPRVAFSKLPVQPDIEGWLIAILGSQSQRRYWAVLALQRMYLFSDNSDVDPYDAIDLKDKHVQPVTNNDASRERFAADLRGSWCLCLDPARRSRAELPDVEARAFEVRCVRPASFGGATMLSRLSKPRTRLALVAESPDLMEKWVNLITSGPY